MPPSKIKNQKRRELGSKAYREETLSLDPGDTIEYGLSTHVTYRVQGQHSEFWPKMSATTTVREGETGEQAMRRLTLFVEDHLDQKVTEIVVTGDR